MSIKTTIVLLVLLVAVAITVQRLKRDDLPNSKEDRVAFASVDFRELKEIKFTPGKARTPELPPFVLIRDENSSWFVEAPSVDNGRRYPARTDRCLSLVEVLRDATFTRRLAKSTPNQPGQQGLIETQGDLVTLVTSSGAVNAVFGFDIDSTGIVLRVGDAWPPCVVDKAVHEEIRRAPQEWRERRMIPADPTHVRSVALVRNKKTSARIAKESGRWLMTDPQLGRADQSYGDRLAALAVTMACGDGSSVPPASALTLSVEVELANSTVKRHFELAYLGSKTWLRASESDPWLPGASAVPELFIGPASDLRSRKLFDCDPQDIISIEWKREGTPRVAYRRIAGGWFFEPPDEFAWSDLNGKKPAIPLDRLAGPRLIESIAAAEAERLSETRPNQVDFEIKYLVSKDGAPPSQGTIKVGPSENGGLAFVASHGTAGSLRQLALSAFEIPWWTIIQRQLNTTAPWSITEVDVTDSSGRKVAIRATSTSSAGFNYTMYSPEHPKGVAAPKEQVDSMLAKITGLAAKRFDGMKAPQDFGLTSPRFVIRWKDTVQRSESELTINPKVGRWYTWRIGADDGDGGMWGDYPDSLPSLIFSTERRELDPFIDLLTPK